MIGGFDDFRKRTLFTVNQLMYLNSFCYDYFRIIV